jgi:hypothetical protein
MGTCYFIPAKLTFKLMLQYTSHGTTVVLADHTVPSATTEVTTAGGHGRAWSCLPIHPLTEHASQERVWLPFRPSLL